MAETSIDRLTLEILLKDNDLAKRLNEIAKALENVKKASGDIDKVSEKLNKISPTSTGGGRTSKGGTNKTSKNLNIFATLGKWNYMINMTRYYGRSLANVVQLAMDYVETQNLWQVANRNNLEMAEQFIQKMNKAYGISEQTLMNYQAIFKNMLSALGDLSDEISSGLSMQLTQMALDFSSLYNVTIPSAMQKFQAVLSGQVRPIRSVSGYDITENTIYDLYAGAGGEKTMRQLSQIEKRLLRIVAVFDQMGATGATGDMAKTIESASNQARIMAEQFKEAKTWAGQMVLTWLNNAEVLQYINGVLITMKEVLKSMAYTFGYQEQDFLSGLVTTTEEASEAIDEIQGKLLSFDKFEALNSADSNVLGIDNTVLKLLENINFEMNDFKMKAQELAEDWLKILGYTYNEESGLWETSKAMNNLSHAMESIKEFAVQLFNTLKPMIPKIVDLFKSILPTLNKLASSVLKVIIKFIESIVPMIVDMVDIIAPFLSDVLPVLGDIVLSLIPIVNAVIDLTSALAPLTKMLTSLLVTILKPIINILKPIIQLISWIATFIVKDLIFGINGVLLALTPIMYILETIVKLISSVIQGLADIATFNWSNFGKNQKEIWSNWASNDWAKSSWSGFKNSFSGLFKGYATGGFPEDGFFFANSGEMVGQFSNGRTAVANNDQIVTGITQGVYNAMMAYNAQTRGQGGSGDVYLDGTKVGRVVAKSSHNEMVRVGLVKANR